VPHNRLGLVKQKTPRVGVFYWLGGAISLLVAGSVFSGDAQGRVNLLLLLFWYGLLPLVLSAITLSSLFTRRHAWLQHLLDIKIWPSSWFGPWRERLSLAGGELWAAVTVQSLALGFSLGSLGVYFLLLLLTDINFVWRSTLLDAETLYGLLKWIAAPWWFWDSAQPSLELLQLTQDSRLAEQAGSSSDYYRWWQFVLALQCFYVLLPRGLILLATYFRLRRKKLTGYTSSNGGDTESIAAENLAPLLVKPEKSVALCNWNALPDAIVEQVKGVYADFIQETFVAGASADPAQQAAAERWQGRLLVLVKSWEPPLAELGDFMQGREGYLLPLDYHADKILEPKQVHLDEWRRFAAQFGWSVIRWGEWH